jgi:hypothetical protein
MRQRMFFFSRTLQRSNSATPANGLAFFRNVDGINSASRLFMVAGTCRCKAASYLHDNGVAPLLLDPKP